MAWLEKVLSAGGWMVGAIFFSMVMTVLVTKACDAAIKEEIGLTAPPFCSDRPACEES